MMKVLTRAQMAPASLNKGPAAIPNVERRRASQRGGGKGRGGKRKANVGPVLRLQKPTPLGFRAWDSGTLLMIPYDPAQRRHRVAATILPANNPLAGETNSPLSSPDRFLTRFVAAWTWSGRPAGR